MSRVTVITATIGRPALERCIKSVAEQTYQNIQHLVFVDGPAAFSRTLDLNWNGANVDVINLPYPCGNNRWNGHRICGAGTFLADENSEYLMFLDDDNTIDPDHVESLFARINTTGTNGQLPGWVFSLRKIVDEQGNFICNDDCESLGLWPSICHHNDYFVDVNCWFLPRKLAVTIAPLWFRKFREPGQPEIDRIITANLRHLVQGNYATTGKYSVNYAVGGSALSVQADFFKQGNPVMAQRYSGGLPWQKM